MAKKKSSGKKPDVAPQKRMQSLAEEIRKHQHLYYVKKQPLVTDREFDRMLKELQDLEEAYPLLADPNSPTRMVGSDLESEFPKFKHTIPVLSLANTYSTEEAMEWARKAALPGEHTIAVQWKVDGATLVLYYEKGHLIRAVTRGSGQTGDDVTANALTIRNVPHSLAEPVDLVVRGEVYMTFDDFQSFNEQWGSIYANPRNLTAGSLKQKRSREVAARPLRWVAFEGHFARERHASDREVLERLSQLGLPTFEDNAFVSTERLPKTIQEFEKKRKKIGFPVDGLVLKIDDLRVREELGSTAVSPRWATSLKFEPEQGKTTVEEIELFVGRTGRVTPRARLKPVKLAGTTVSYATLHNADFIANLGVRVGSTVIVSKRGEIIPAVEEVVDPGSGPEFVFPESCPSCHTKLVREEDAVDFRCPNPDCDEKLINGIIFFCQRKQMDIAGLGDKVIRTLYANGYIRSLEDIYRLHEKRGELEEREGFGKRSVQILLDGIEKSKEREFRRVLHSLGLREVGPFVADVLVREGYDSMDAILALVRSSNAEEILDAMDGIGPSTTKAILEQFADERILRKIESLRRMGLRFAETRSPSEEMLPQIFAGQNWCVTGSFENFHPRDLAMEEVRKRGGKTVNTVSSKTTHLLAGEAAGSKLEKAHKLGVTVVSETEFMKMLGIAAKNA